MTQRQDLKLEPGSDTEQGRESANQRGEHSERRYAKVVENAQVPCSQIVRGLVEAPFQSQ
jgi:hypothetical protein